MKPAFQIDLRDPERALEQLLALLDRDASKSWSVETAIPQPQALTTNETSYLPIVTPIEAGVTARRVRIIPSENYRIAVYGNSVRIAVGFRSADRFEVVGREWSSKTHALSIGTPFDLLIDEQPVREGFGLVVRVTRIGWPTSWPTNATVETTLGYDPGA